MARLHTNQPAERSETPFSARLESWLEQDKPKTIGALNNLIDKKSFALILMLLLVPSAIPIPTGGVTHVLELIAVLVALQLVVGRSELWLPRRVSEHELGEIVTGTAVPAIIRRVRWFERWARPRFAELLDRRIARSVLGVFVLLSSSARSWLHRFPGLIPCRPSAS